MTNSHIAPPSAPLLTNAADKRSRLRRAKHGASALLGLAVVVLVGARLYPHPSTLAALIRAAAEAAIVGGLADWFAVTALFRRPLGLPIPHTALIPKRKDEIGRSLGNFVSEQFLAPDLLIARLHQQNRAAQLARWLDTPAIASFLAERLVAVVPLALTGTDDTELRRFFATIGHEGLRRMNFLPTIDAVIDALLRRDNHLFIAEGLIDLIMKAVAGLKEPLVARIGERTGRFFPSYFDRKIGQEIVDGIVVWLAAARTPGTNERQRLDLWIRDWIARLRSDPEWPDLIARAQASLVNQPALVQSLGAIWDELKRELLLDAAASAPKMGSLGAQLVRTVGRLIQESDAVQQHFNTALDRVVLSSIAPWRRQIGSYIAEIVVSWDGETVAELMELQVGRDLQYIRVNGTLVGALVGSALFLIGSALPSLWRAIW